MIGKTVAHYRIVEKLGEGGMGAVYLADDTRLDRKVALKFLPPQLTNDPSALTRFEREAKSAAALHHPNIVTVYEIGEHDGHRFIAMAYIGGDRLGDLIERKSMPLDRALEIAIALCDALKEAHAAGIIHRDIKPDNILFDPSGRAMLADFGLATSSGGTRITQEGSTVGTLHYMSPEQTRGEELDARSDIFSVGAVLYEMITGRLAFGGDQSAAIMYAIANETPQPLSRYSNEATPELERIVFKALSKDVETRYQSVADMMADLKALRSSPSVTAATASTGERNAAAARTSWRIPVIAVGVLAVIVAGYLLRSIVSPDVSQGAVAVLPFLNTSQDPETEYLSAGVTESLINHLSALSDLRVMSHHSVSRFRDADRDPQAIGRQLGVSTVLVGHVDSRGDKLVVGVELLNVEDGSQLWGDRFDRDRADILAIEKDIVAHISDRLSVRLTGEDSRRLEQRQEIDPEAYNLYLRGRYVLQGTGHDSHARAQNFFRQAIEVEPHFALAWAALGDSYVNQAWLSSAAREEMLPKAREALSKAMEIDGELSEVHLLYGMIKMYFDWDWAEADAAFRRAIEISPGSDTAHRYYAAYLNLVHRFDESIVEARKAQALDPLSVVATHTLAFNLMCAQRYEEAAAEFRKAIDLNPTWLWGHIKLAMTCALMGDHTNAEVARARADELLGDESGSPLSQHWRARVELLAGKPQRMRETLANLQEQAQTGYVDPFVLALVHHDLGEHDRALDLLEEAFEMRSTTCVYLSINRILFFDEIMEHPRYVSLVERMSYPDVPSS